MRIIVRRLRIRAKESGGTLIAVPIPWFRNERRVDQRYLATGPPTDDDVERAQRIARERGLLRPDGTWVTRKDG